MTMYLLKLYPYLFLLFCSISVGIKAQKKELLIIHTNDVHSQIEPTATDDSQPDMGGTLRRQVVIDSLRNTGKAVLLIDAGDAVQGTPYFTTYRGKAEIALMNRLKYDFITPGNHEFDNGTASLATMYKDATPVIVNCNYDVSNTPLKRYFTPGVIKEIGGWKVGITGVGVALKTSVDPEKVTGIICRDAIVSATRTADSLKRCGAEIVVLLSHLGIEGDKELARKSCGIDIIAGGHSHTLLPTPIPVINKQQDTVWIGQTGKRGLYVGVIECKGDTRRGYTIDLSSRYDNRIDSVTAALIDSYRIPMQKTTGEVIGNALKPMTVGRPQSPLSNFTADVLVQQARKEGIPCDFGLINIGAIRCDIARGAVTKGDILSCYPFDNYICHISLPGREVKRLFRIIASRGGEGISREVELTLSPDRKIKRLAIGGKKIKPRRIYHITTIDFTANGGDEMTPLTRHRKRIDTKTRLCDLMTAAFGETTIREGGVSASTDRRIIYK